MMLTSNKMALRLAIDKLDSYTHPIQNLGTNKKKRYLTQKATTTTRTTVTTTTKMKGKPKQNIFA